MARLLNADACAERWSIVGHTDIQGVSKQLSLSASGGRGLGVSARRHLPHRLLPACAHPYREASRRWRRPTEAGVPNNLRVELAGNDGAHFMRRAQRRAALRLCLPLALLAPRSLTSGASMPRRLPDTRGLPHRFRHHHDESHGKGAAAVERCKHIEGATGHITAPFATRSSKKRPPVPHDLGDGPNKWCVPTTGSLRPASAIAAPAVRQAARALRGPGKSLYLLSPYYARPHPLYCLIVS